MTGEGEEFQPFRIEVPDSELADLRDRLDRARPAPEPRGGLFDGDDISVHVCSPQTGPRAARQSNR